MLRTIEQEALQVYFPKGGLYSAIPALHCEACLCRLHASSNNPQGRKSSTWRGTYVQSNAFDKCEHFDKPTWLRVLPIDANDLWREDFLDPAPKTSNASEAGEEQGRRGCERAKCQYSSTRKG